MSIDKVITLYKGMHFEGELRSLNRWGDTIHEGVIVAIGSYCGQSDCALALHAHVPVYAIDPRSPSDDVAFGDQDRAPWMENVLDMGLAEKIRPINLPSLTVAKVWSEPISFLFIDGDHQQVAADLEAWFPFVVDGGLIGIHDNNRATVIQAVTGRDDMVEIERADLTTIYRKEPLYEPFTYITESGNLPMFVRKGPYNHDDLYVLSEVRSYDVGTDVPRTILDIGGHIGAFACWMASEHPEADIVTVEPELSNFKLLAKNAESYPNVTVMRGRIGYDPALTSLEVNPVNSGCHRVLRTEDVVPGQSVVTPPPAHTIEWLMEKLGWDSISILKIDCEGCEADVLMNCPDDTLRKVRRIVGEFHTNFDSPMEPLAERLGALGFMVTAETNPAAHATFVAVNQNWVAPAETNRSVQVDIPYFKAGDAFRVGDVPEKIEYGLPIEEAPKSVKKSAAKKPIKKGSKK